MCNLPRLDRFPRLNWCCLCINLRIGAYLVALFTVIGFIAKIVLHIKLTWIQTIPVVFFIFMILTNVVFGFILSLLSLVLCIAVYKSSSYVLKLWLYIELTSLIFTITIEGLIVPLAYKRWDLTVGLYISYVIRIFWWLSINTLRMDLVEEEERPNIVSGNQQREPESAFETIGRWRDREPQDIFAKIPSAPSGDEVLPPSYDEVVRR